MSLLQPTDSTELTAIIADAHRNQTPLEIIGSGTKRVIGNPVQAAHTLSLSQMTGITLYEPSELVIRARAGTSVAAVEAALAEKGQRLPFEPIALDQIASGGDGAAASPSIGGLAATNMAGPRRIMAGAVRDSMIGIAAVNGQGEPIKSGGRVMKDVTGLDLVKLLAGSWGTLAVMSEITFKVLPIPETEASVVIHGLDDHQGIARLSAALGSPFEVTGAAHLPDGRTAMRLEGFAASVAYRGKALLHHLACDGEILDAVASRDLWRQIGHVAMLTQSDDWALWRVSVAPSRGASIAAALRSAVEAQILFDWGGGLIWAAVPGAAAVTAGETLRHNVQGQGHTTFIRGPEHARAIVGAFEPLPAPTARMAARIQAVFDPGDILNPGRMYGAA